MMKPLASHSVLLLSGKMRGFRVGIAAFIGQFAALAQLCSVSMQGDGHCDPVCMSSQFNYDSSLGQSDCSVHCPPACTATMLSNSLCDPACMDWRCAWDSPSCSHCSPDCPVSLLGNGECNWNCATEPCNWDAGECVSEQRPAEYYVGSDRSLYETLAGVWTQWTNVWLVGSLVTLSSSDPFPVLEVESSLTIATLLCSASPHPLCQFTPATLRLSPRHPLFSVSGRLILRDLSLSGYFSLLGDESGLTYCPYRELKDGIWRNDRGEEVQEADNSPLCEEYWEHSLFTVVETGHLMLQNVQLTGLKQQLKAIIANQCGSITLQSVSFIDCMSRPRDSQGGLILQTSVPQHLQPYWCGELLFLGGSVELLNNGYEFRTDLRLGSFLVGAGFRNVTVWGVKFEFNFVPTATSSLLNLGTTRSLLISNTSFLYNIGGLSAGLSLLSDLTFPPSPSEESFLHITLTNVNFTNNTSQACTCVCLSFLNHQQNVHMAGVTFQGNYSPRGYLASITSAALTDVDSLGGVRTGLKEVSPAKSMVLTGLCFDTNYGLGALFLSNIANIDLRNSTFFGQSANYSELNSVSAAFTSNSAAYISSLTLYPQNAACQCTVQVSTAGSLVIAGVEVRQSRCKEGVSGVRVSGTVGKVSGRQVVVEKSRFEGNEGKGALTIETKTDVSLQFLTFTSNRNLHSGNSPALDISFQLPSHLSLSDSLFSHNTALSASAILASSTLSLTLIRVVVRGNVAMASTAGVLYNPIPTAPSLFKIVDSSFEENKADSFGAVAVIDLQGLLMGNRLALVTFLVSGSIFRDNLTTSQGCSITLYKFTQFSPSSLISRSLFTGNTSNRGPGVYCEYETGIVTVEECRFVKNVSAKGSAVLAHQYPSEDVASRVVLRGNWFEGNSGSATVAVDGWEKPCTVVSYNNTFISNLKGAVQSSTGIFQDSNSRYLSNPSKASIVKLTASQFSFSNCTFTNNTVTGNGGIFFLSQRATLKMQGSVVQGNTVSGIGGVVYADQGSGVKIRESYLVGNKAGTQGSVAYMLTSTLNLTSCVVSLNSAKLSFTIVLLETTASVHNTTFDSNWAGRDAGISVTFTAITISNSTFSNQTSTQGGFLISGLEGNILISESVFRRGVARDQGGAIYCTVECVLRVSNSLFEDCSAGTQGSAIYVLGANMTLSNTSLHRSKTEGNQGAVFVHVSSVQLTNLTFTDTIGGAVFADSALELNIANSQFQRGNSANGGFIHCENCRNVTIRGSSLQSGTAESGGALHIEAVTSGLAGKCVVQGNVFEYNHAEKGGAVLVEGVDCTIDSNGFSNNSASSSGGALSLRCPSGFTALANNSFTSNSATLAGGALFWAGSSPVFSSNSYAGNTAFYGKDVASRPVALRLTGRNELTNLVSGSEYRHSVVVGLYDHRGNLVLTADGYVGEIGPGNNSADLSFGGDLKDTSKAGLFVFTQFTATAEPGSRQTAYVTVDGLGLEPLPVPLEFRLCRRGESYQGQQCLKCPEMTYSLQPENPCFQCPEEAECLGGAEMVPKAGYWRPDNDTATFFECYNKDACLGSDDPLVLNQCAEGYTGNLCQSCTSSFSRSGKNKCARCPNLASNVAIITVISLALVTGLAFLVYISLSNASKAKSQAPVLVKILMNYLQLVVVASSLNIKWPSAFASLLTGQEKAGAATSQLTSYTCLALDVGYSGEVVYLTGRLMGALPACLLVLTSGYWWVHARLRGVSYLKEKVICSWTLALFSIHPTITSEMLSLLACRELQPNRLWLLTELSLACWEGSHLQEVLSVVLPSLLVWVLGLPFLAFLYLWRKRKSLTQFSTVIAFGFLYRGYEEKTFYWEFVIILRKALSISAVVAMSTQVIQIQALSVLAVLLLFFYCHIAKFPFFQRDLNLLESKSIFVSIVTIYAGLYFSSQHLGTL